MDKVKKALRGLKACSLFPVTANTTTAYAVGDPFELPAIQSLSKADTAEEYTIPADDVVYDTGTEFQHTDIEAGFAEMSNEQLATITGGKYDEVTEEYTAANLDEAPEMAMAYAALQLGGGHRCFKHPVVKLMRVTVSHTTKGQGGTEIAPYTLSFRVTPRKFDGVYRLQRDVAKGEELTYLTYFTALPVEEPEG